MWAEITLNLINEEAVREYDRKVKEGKIQVRDRNAVFPLSILCRKMCKGPPLLSRLIDAFEGNLFAEEFIGLVRELLPDKEVEIMAESVDKRPGKFCAIFSKRYFPIADDRYYDNLGDLVRSMPINLQGMTEEDYHNFADLRPGCILMLSLINSPFEYEYEAIGEGSKRKWLTSDKVPILDMTGTLIQDIDLLKKIPRHGWTNLEIRKRVESTPLWWGLADYADWVNLETEWDLLNYSGEDAIITIPWSLDTVKSLTIEWPRIEAFWKRIEDMASWLEKDIPGHYRELVETLLKGQPSRPKRERRVKTTTLTEVLNNE
ncbi:MAG: hypothetical protein WC404_04905 [Candidatus Omnitrophota bacterium]|jgi:hypothetical protein